jgi:hypothetical protein
MPIKKPCPKCGTECSLNAFVPGVVFGYRCRNCGCEFDVWSIVVGWQDCQEDCIEK